MEKTQSYLARGRPWETLPLEQLKANWVTALRQWISNGFGESRALGDLETEMRLRQVDPPYDLVPNETKAMHAAVVQGGPSNPGLRQEIDQFLAEKDKPKH